MIDFMGVITFFLSWWAISLVMIGFILTTLLGCFMIVGLFKVIWKRVFPRKYYSPQFKD